MAGQSLLVSAGSARDALSRQVGPSGQSVADEIDLISSLSITAELSEVSLGALETKVKNFLTDIIEISAANNGAQTRNGGKTCTTHLGNQTLANQKETPLYLHRLRRYKFNV